MKTSRVFQVVELMEKVAESKSVSYNSKELSYPFMFGYFKGETKTLLDRLNLNKKQLKVLEDYSNTLVNRII